MAASGNLVQLARYFAKVAKRLTHTEPSHRATWIACSVSRPPDRCRGFVMEENGPAARRAAWNAPDDLMPTRSAVRGASPGRAPGADSMARVRRLRGDGPPPGPPDGGGPGAVGLARPESGPREHLAFAAPERHRLRAADRSGSVGVRQSDPADGGAAPTGLRARAHEDRRARAVRGAEGHRLENPAPCSKRWRASSSSNTNREPPIDGSGSALARRRPGPLSAKLAGRGVRTIRSNPPGASSVMYLAETCQLAD